MEIVSRTGGRWCEYLYLYDPMVLLEDTEIRWEEHDEGEDNDDVLVVQLKY